jgi:hypothetical protein
VSEAPRAQGAEPEEPPPLLGTWRRLYALVLFELLALAAALYALSRWAA